MPFTIPLTRRIERVVDERVEADGDVLFLQLLVDLRRLELLAARVVDDLDPLPLLDVVLDQLADDAVRERCSRSPRSTGRRGSWSPTASGSRCAAGLRRPRRRAPTGSATAGWAASRCSRGRSPARPPRCCPASRSTARWSGSPAASPAGGMRAGVGTGWPHRIGWPAAAAGAGSGVVAGAGPRGPGSAGAGAWGGATTGAGAGAGAAGTTERSWVGAGAGVGFAGLVRAGGVGPGMLDGAAGGGSLPGGVWAPAGMASHVDIAAARRMRELSMRQLCVPLHQRGTCARLLRAAKKRRHTALRGRFADPKRSSVQESDAGGQTPAGGGHGPVGVERPVGQGAGVHVDLEFAALQVAADQLLGERILDVALDGAAQRTRAVRAVLAGQVDDPVDRLGGQPDAQAPIDQVGVQLPDQQLA